MNALTLNTPGVSGKIDVDLTDKVAVISINTLGERFKKPQFQLFKVTGGFGAKPDAMGSKVFGTYLADGEDSYTRRGNIIGIASDELVAKVLAEKAVEDPIDLTKLCYFALKAGRGGIDFCKDETLAGALKGIKAKFPAKGVVVYRCHPEARLNDFGGITYPAGTTLVEVK
jgi:hypothetical protein